MASQVLYATDFSEIAGHAFDEALTVAKAMGAEVVIAHVLHFPPMVSELRPMAEEVEDAMRLWCNHRLAELAGKAQAAGVKAQTILREGAHAHAGLTKLAEELKPAMIILGTHGRTGISKVVLGSVAARVITEAPCPVLVVRAK